MIKTILFKELKELVRDTRFKITALIVLILFVIAGFTSYQQYNKITKQQQESEQRERALWDSQSEKNPHSAAHDGTYVFKPVNPLTMIDNGVSSYTGSTIFLEAHSRNNAQYSEAFDEMEFTRTNKLTLNFVLLYLFPLLILLLGFNSMSKEKELDTLRLLKSQGVTGTQLILGKWLSIFTVVLHTTIIVFAILGTTLSIAKSEVSFNAFNFAGMFLVYLCYYAIITTITLLISVVSKSSGLSLVINLSIWVLCCFVTPKIATNFASQIHETPTKQSFKNAISKDQQNRFNGHDPNNEAGKKFKASILKKYNVKTTKELDFNYTGLIMQKGEEEASKVYSKHYTKLYNIFEKQNLTYQSLAFLSPFIPARLFSMDLAQTGYRANAYFSDQTDAYRIVVQKFLNDDLKNNSKMGDWNYKMKADQFKNMPKFSPKEIAISEIVNQNSYNILLLGLWLVLTFILLILSSKRI